ncbi:MAG: type II toxin-antitoxin system prevent-host-death family antitoxin [Pseudomonadota bacterium]|nr:type II toxin-antitoxin system prevent-host-death family antitoxin [Pseudomonadota bacterium]
MTTVTLTDFRSHASGMLTRVERGETLVVLRHGRPIAEISPITKQNDDSLPSWKRQALRLSTKGEGLSSAILQERACENLS